MDRDRQGIPFRPFRHDRRPAVLSSLPNIDRRTQHAVCPVPDTYDVFYWCMSAGCQFVGTLTESIQHAVAQNPDLRRPSGPPASAAAIL